MDALRTVTDNGLPRRVLVIALKHIGDVLVATPALRALREHWPQAEIELLVSRGMGELVRGLPDITSLREVDRKTLRGRPLAEWSFVRELRARHYAVAIDLTGGERSAWYAFLSGAELRIGVDDPGGFPGRRHLFHHVTPWGKGHYTENFMAVLKPLGITGKTGKMNIAIPAQAFAETTAIRSQYKKYKVVIHPVSRWMFKSWPAETCAEFIAKIKADTTTVLLTSGPDAGEMRHGAEIMAQLPQNVCAGVTDLCGKLTLPGLAALIADCDLFAGVDSAPMHIASACGVPAVALFGPSGEHNWGPWGNPHRVVTAPQPCRPCGRDGCNGSKRSRCLELITAEQVATAASELCPGLFT